MFTVYAIKSDRDSRIYVGMTNDLQQRLKEYNAGKTKSTKGYRPWRLLYFQSVGRRLDARKLELRLKTGSGREFLKTIEKNVPVAQLDRASAF